MFLLCGTLPLLAVARHAAGQLRFKGHDGSGLCDKQNLVYLDVTQRYRSLRLQFEIKPLRL
jgi:hypothetical protein